MRQFPDHTEVPEMTQYSIDLPFFMSLDEGDYLLAVAERRIEITHSVMARENFDPRIGGITAGSFSFVRDQFGALRYSCLTINLGDEELGQVGEILTGKAKSLLRADDYRRKAELALAVFNRFLDKYRVATRKLDVKPIGPWDLALLRFTDGRNSGEVRLYGGGITLPIAGLIPAAHSSVLSSIADPTPNAAFEIAAVDALRAVADGQTLESMVTAVGALEAALDLFFSRTWRRGGPRVFPPNAATTLRLRRDRVSNAFTIEDVLEIAGVRAKVEAYARVPGMTVEQRDSLLEAIDLRNLAVHGGIRVPQRKAEPHVHLVTNFVLDHIAPQISAECPPMPRAELLYACEEALGSACSPDLETIVNTYLTPLGLTSQLSNQRFKQKELSSERFGNSIVIRISFRDFSPDETNLAIAQIVLYHHLERRGDVAQARAADDPNDSLIQERRPFFEVVASQLTRTVWIAAINNRLKSLGFAQHVHDQTHRHAEQLRSRYHRTYSPPSFSELSYWVDYLDIALVGCQLAAPDRESLIATVERRAPETARRSHAAIPALQTVDFDDLESIRAALIQVHDAHGGILASASIFDPVTRERYGFGLRLEDFGIIALTPASLGAATPPTDES
jgi:hypothetical protein